MRMRVRMRMEAVKSELARLVADTRGAAAESVLGTTITWGICFGVFLLNVQLGQLAHARDVVDHSAAVASSVAKNNFCATAEDKGGTEEKAQKAIRPVVQTTSANDQCKVKVDPKGESGDPGSKQLDVSLDCTFDCMVPFAAQLICKKGKIEFKSKLSTVSMGCDGKPSS